MNRFEEKECLGLFDVKRENYIQLTDIKDSLDAINKIASNLKYLLNLFVIKVDKNEYMLCIRINNFI